MAGFSLIGRQRHLESLNLKTFLIVKVASVVSKIKEDMLVKTLILFHLGEQYSLERVTGFLFGLLIGSQILVAFQPIKRKYEGTFLMGL